MENENLTNEWVRDTISKILDNGLEAAKEAKENRGDPFAAGRRLAYYEVLDILQSALDARGQDLAYYRLDIDLLNTIE